MQRLTDPRHVAVAEDPEAPAEEGLLDAVPLDDLRGQEPDERLRRRQPKEREPGPEFIGPGSRCVTLQTYLRRRRSNAYAPNTSLKASRYACAFPDGPFSVIPSGRSGWL